MKLHAKTDLVESFQRSLGERGLDFQINPRDLIDGRGSLLISFVRSWGMGVVLGEALSQMNCEEHNARATPPMTSEQLVMRCADLVDKVYDEMQRRSWMIVTPSGVEQD